MPQGIVTLLALVGSGVIGLAVGAWLGLFVVPLSQSQEEEPDNSE